MWAYLGILSALLLGFYDICKKHSVRENATLPVLFLSTFFGAITVLPALVISRVDPSLSSDLGLMVTALTPTDHLLISVKSMIISVAWTLSYFAIKHLPISIVSPIRASSPIFTLMGALFIFGESPNLLQWCGILIIITSFFIFSTIGKKEGINFKSNKWIYAIILGAIANSCSGLYDKFLIQSCGYTPQTVQVWFSFYLVAILGMVVILFWFPLRKKHTTFQWRWSIPFIGILLILADAAYFRALNNPDALIVLVSCLRRGRVVVAIALGGYIFKETNKGKKLKALIGILLGVGLIIFSK